MTAMKDNISVIVVGAGPVGLLVALRLAMEGVPTTVLEALPAIEQSPRAMVYQPVAVKELDRAGILGELRKIGGIGKRICWRKTSNKEVIVELHREATKENPYENLVVGQHELAAVIMEHLQRFENATVLFNQRVTKIKENGDGWVVVVTEGPDGKEQTHSASYLVGADGGRSSIRKLCGIGFEGFQYPEQLVSTNVFFPFDKYGWAEGNFMMYVLLDKFESNELTECSDPEHWALIAKINEEGLWRVSYGEKDGLSLDEIKERMPWKFSNLFPDSEPDYKLDQMSPYRLNQRCATKFREGNIMLAGDAAHLCSPFGGLGLTGGLLDAAALADALIFIYQGKATDEILDQYAETRRGIFVNTVNPTSQANKERLHMFDPETIGETDPFLRMLRHADEQEQQKIRSHMTLAVDMRQFLPTEVASKS